MEFQINEYHRNVPDEELLADLVRVANELKKDYIIIAEYNKYGKYHRTTITNRFGNWNKALEKAGLKKSPKHHYNNSNNIDVTPEKLLHDLKDVASLLEKKSITTTEYEEYGKHGHIFIISRFKTWENALIQAGLEPTGYHNKVTKQELLEEIERVWIKLGRQPTTTDIKNGVSKYSLNSYARKFGGWRAALVAFVEWINEKTDEPEIEEKESERIVINQGSDTESVSHKTKRDINLRLRFKVMQRDNFKCAICGSSPAKDPSVELHIDHIIPWSKGGETVIENLQTLCSKCNLGKSNLL